VTREDVMEQHEPQEPTSAAPSSREERSIDEMVEETFPASDATQLPGRAAGAPAPNAVHAPPQDDDASDEVTPRTIGNQGVIPASRRLQTVALGNAGEVTLRLDTEHRRLQLYFSRDAMTLDAKALDRLIAALSAKRVQMSH
jgi:hypothetical protein